VALSVLEEAGVATARCGAGGAAPRGAGAVGGGGGRAGGVFEWQLDIRATLQVMATSERRKDMSTSFREGMQAFHVLLDYVGLIV
jgi:hypothetical protein